MQQMQGPPSKRHKRLRIIGFIAALLILIAGAIFWAFSSLNSLPALLTTIFGALATIFSFFQLVPLIFAHDIPQPTQISPSTSVPQPINIYNVLPSPQPAPFSPTPSTSTPPSLLTAPSVPTSSTLRAFPLPTDPRTIQQREHLVEDVYTLLTASETSSVAITGIGGIGKSTLAALALNYAERERRLGKGPFRREPVLLRINENTSFLELATNLLAAVEKPVPDLSSISPQNQAFAIFNALNSAETADSSRLIILDQFENFLDLQSGYALPTSAGVGELLDTLNSQPSACRICSPVARDLMVHAMMRLPRCASFPSEALINGKVRLSCAVWE